MDRSKFKENAPGQLVKIQLPEKDWAFVPDSLPPDWTFPTELWPILAEAKESLARLDGIGRTLPNPDLLLHPLQSREALRSSSLEGTYASPEELLLFELGGRARKMDERANAWLEVSNYHMALRKGVKMLEELPLSLRLVRELHRTLLAGVRGRERAPGQFRDYQVHIGSDRRYIPPPQEYLPDCLSEFEKRMNEDDANYDSLVRCYLLHYQFEAIHPFRDGNGRVGRALLSLMILSWCNVSKPWLYMSAFFERYKDEYIDKLFRVSTHGDWGGWVKFCLLGTISQSQDAMRRCDQLRLLKDDFHIRADHTSIRAHSIIDALFTSPVVTTPHLVKRFAVSYPTAKSDIKRLVKVGILEEVSGMRPKAYISPKIFGIAYREQDDGAAPAE